MNSQNDDYLKQSTHWIYADLCSWNTGRGQNENKEFENCNIQCTLFTLSTLSNIYPILLQPGYFSHWTRWLNSFFYPKLLQFFNEYDTSTNCNNCVSQNKCLICCLLTFNKLFIPFKAHFKAKADICFCFHSLKDDVIDEVKI